MIVCIAEDRRQYEPALQAVLQSLLLHNPDLPVALFCPDPSSQFVAWLAAKPSVKLRKNPTAATGWNVKPALLLALLREGHEQVMWLDSDMVVLGKVESALPAHDDGSMLVLAEEALWGKERLDRGGQRTRGWGFPAGRELPHVLNSCVIRATKHHLALLERWDALLNDPKYLAAQMLRFSDRPVHLGGDQDVLTAILGSASFAEIPLHILKRGRDIIQFFGPFGFTTSERLALLNGQQPVFVHSQGTKPWLPQPEKPVLNNRFADRIMQVYSETSPYLITAQELDLAYINGNQWLRPRSVCGTFLRNLGFGSVAFTGLPIAMAFDTARLAKSVAGYFRASAGN